MRQKKGFNICSSVVFLNFLFEEQMTNGSLEGWKGGELEEWKNGRLEDWKIGLEGGPVMMQDKRGKR